MNARAIADAVGGRVVGDGDIEVSAVRPIDTAGPSDLAFIADDQKRLPDPTRIDAGVLIVSQHVPTDRYLAVPAQIVVPFAKKAWCAALELLHPSPAHVYEGISSAAHIDPQASIGASAAIGPNVTVEAGARIGERTILYPGAFIGQGADIGADVVVYPSVTIYARSIIGDRCILHAGCIIGSDGFGYAPTPQGAHKVPHVGRAVIENDCEIGANTTIDRGALDDTVILEGTKIDNLVQIAHNCRVGPHALLAAQVGLAGTTTVGMGVQLGGQVGVGGHLEIGAGSRVGAKAGLHADVPPGTNLLGTPAMEAKLAARVFAAMRRLPEMRRELQRLTKRLTALESDDSA